MIKLELSFSFCSTTWCYTGTKVFSVATISIEGTECGRFVQVCGWMHKLTRLWQYFVLCLSFDIWDLSHLLSVLIPVNLKFMFKHFPQVCGFCKCHTMKLLCACEQGTQCTGNSLWSSLHFNVVAFIRAERLSPDSMCFSFLSDAHVCMCVLLH